MAAPERSLSDPGTAYATLDRQGERVEVQDQNQTVHAFDFDGLGRPTEDRITAFGTGVDTAVRRIERTYEVRGMVEHVTSYDNATVGQGSVANDVLHQYDSLGRLSADYQNHLALATTSSPSVQYGFADLTTGMLRPTSLTYPNGRVVNLT